MRLIDVVGNGSTADHTGAPIHDPYPTPFATGGFDAEAVGVLHSAPEPAPAAMLAAGALGVAGLARRRRARACGTRA